MKELICPYAHDLEIFNDPIRKKDFFSFEFDKVLFNRFNQHGTMTEEPSKTEEDWKVNKELERFDDILKQHSDQERQSGNPPIDRMDCSQSDMVGNMDRMQPTAIRGEPNSLLDKLHDKKINLVLVATSLDESDVVKKLESTLDPTKSNLIPLKFNHEKKSHDDNGILVNRRSSTESHDSKSELNDVKSSGPKSPRRTNKNSAQEKDGKYWKRRSSNNEAAKKSRDARKARFEWIENRTKELDVENASLRKELDNLTQEVLHKEKNGFEK